VSFFRKKKKATNQCIIIWAFPFGVSLSRFFREAFRYIFFAEKKAKKDAASNKRSDSRNTFEDQLWN